LDGEKRADLKKTKATAGKGKKAKEKLAEWVEIAYSLARAAVSSGSMLTSFSIRHFDIATYFCAEWRQSMSRN
jgi:hypothetical protein